VRCIQVGSRRLENSRNLCFCLLKFKHTSWFFYYSVSQINNNFNDAEATTVMRPRPVFLASRPRPGRGLNIPDSNKCQCEVTISMSRAACRQVCCEFHSHWSPSAWLVHTRHLTVLPHRSNSCLIITHICVDWTLLASYKSCSKHLNPVQPHTGYYSLINSLLHHMVATLKPFIPTSVAKMSPPKHSASYWSNPPFLFFDIRALWRSVLSSGGSRVGGSLGSDEPPPPLRPDPGVVAENARTGCISAVH